MLLVKGYKETQKQEHEFLLLSMLTIRLYIEKSSTDTATAGYM